MALSRSGRTEIARLEYQLCPSWLDNHLSLASDKKTLPAGTYWEMDLTVMLALTMNADEDVEAFSRQALDSGKIES